MKPCLMDLQKLVITEILFCYREIEFIDPLFLFCIDSYSKVVLDLGIKVKLTGHRVLKL